MAAKKPTTIPEPTHHSPLASCKPLADRVVVRRDMASNTTRSGLIIAAVPSASKQTGIVYAVGPGRYERGELVPMNVKKGDRVLLTGYAGMEIRDESAGGSKDEEFIILREEDILAVLAR